MKKARAITTFAIAATVALVASVVLLTRSPSGRDVALPSAPPVPDRTAPSVREQRESIEERLAAVEAGHAAAGVVDRDGLTDAAQQVVGDVAASPELSVAPDEPVVADDPLVVHFDQDTSVADRRAAVEDAGGTVAGTVEALGVVVVSVPEEDVDAVQAALEDDERVEVVEDNLVRHASGDPNDEGFPFQGNALNSRLSAAFDVTHGVSTTDIAIIDTGVDLDHPDLVGRIASGRDFVNNDTVAQDDNGHGTIVAGIAAADTDNGIGIAGAAWDARIMPVKALDADGNGADPVIAAGIVWATDNGAEIINLSLGGPGTSTVLENAIFYALSNDVVVVAASGNEGTIEPSYPAAYGGVVAVGATDVYGDVVSFSNRGPHIDVVAEGFDVLSTGLVSGPNEGYSGGAGTSFASPFVAGVAALVLARNPTFTPSQVLARLRSTAIDRGPAGIDDAYGFGLIDAYAAVGGRTAAAPPPAQRADLEPNDVPGDAVSFADFHRPAISPEGDVDWYSVLSPQAGIYSLTVTPVIEDGSGSLSFDPVITMYSALPELKQVAAANITGPGQPEVVSGVTAGNGTYLFKVTNALTSRSTGPQSKPQPYTLATGFVAGAGGPATGETGWIADTAPTPLVRNAASSVSPTVTFVRAVTEASAEDASKTAVVDAKAGSVVAATRTYDTGTKTLTIDPSSSLGAGKTHLVLVTGVSDGSDTMSEPFVSRFTVNASTPSVDLRTDFNDDGYEDTVIGVPGEDHGSTADGGVVHVLYGSSTGASASGSQMWSQDSTGIGGSVEAGDKFGAAVASGDLNNDGYDDLVVGAPSEDLGSVRDAGLIHVLLGSSSGLRSTGSSYWTQDSSGIAGTAETGDRFGGALAVGSFDASTGADLAVGAPGESVGSSAGAGAINVIRGASGGLTSTSNSVYTQDSAGIAFLAEAGDLFGGSLATGDLEGDGHDELIAGAPGDDVIGTDEGSITVLRGSVVGIRPAGVIPNADGVTAQNGERFGTSVASADLGGYAARDGYDDIVAGTPGDDVDVTNDGSALLLYADHSGPFLSGELLTQDRDIDENAEGGASFGAAIDARSMSDTMRVVAIGMPNADRTATDAGGVLVMTGFPTAGTSGYFGLGGGATLDQESQFFSGSSESGDHFGSAVELLDANDDGKLDATVGVPDEGIGSSGKAGSVYALLDVTAVLPTPKLIHQDSTSIGSSAEPGDRFGAAV